MDNQRSVLNFFRLRLKRLKTKLKAIPSRPRLHVLTVTSSVLPILLPRGPKQLVHRGYG